jgi:hypothetical protein
MEQRLSAVMAGSHETNSTRRDALTCAEAVSARGVLEENVRGNQNLRSELEG